MLASPGTALLARASRIEGGYGRGPAHGQLFDVRNDALLARFENCLIDLVHVAGSGLSHGASVAFVNCTLTNILDRLPLEEQERAGLVLQGTSIGYFPYDQGEPEQKDMNLLFPDWEQRIDK